MNRHIRILIPFIILSLIAAFIAYSPILVKNFISSYASKKFGISLKIASLSLNQKGLVAIKDIRMGNGKGMRCGIRDAEIRCNPVTLLRGGLNFSFILKGVDFSYPSSAVINGIASTLSVDEKTLGRFDYIEGSFYRKANEYVIKGFKADGKFLKAYLDGTMSGNSAIDCMLKIMLSPEIVASIPENTRKLFFKQGDSWSVAELSISGSTARPSINFSTDLFKLTVR